MKERKQIVLGPVVASHRDGVHRVESVVDGEPIWFESTEVSLAASPEAFATALLPSSCFHRRAIQLTQPVCPAWHAQLPRPMELFGKWWNFPQLMPRPVADEPWRKSVQPAGTGRAVCFTGGVDSFHTLLNYPQPIDTLLYVVDYDVPPHAPTRLSGYEHHMRTIAQQLQLKSITLRSNLRRHHVFRGPSWRQTHGVALIAAGQLVRKSIGELVITASYSLKHRTPHGSRWDLDPLWSSPMLKVVHFGEQFQRFEKLAHIVDNPLVQRYLRPCWENPQTALNCSVCEKCVRTMLTIASNTDLQQFSAFDTSIPLQQRIDGVPKIGGPDLFCVYGDFLDLPLPPEVLESISRLIDRSRASAFRKRTRQRIRRMLSFGRPVAA